MLHIRKEQRRLISELAKEIETKQRNVRICKSVFSGVGVVGATLLFTPVAPLAAVLVGGAAAVGGVGTALGDFFHGKKQADDLKSGVSLG